MTTFKKDCTCGGIETGGGIMHEPCCGVEPEHSDDVTPIELWASACEGAIREVEKAKFEEQGDIAIKQAAKLLALAVKLHYGDDEAAKNLEELHINSSESKQMLARRFLTLPFRHQHAIMKDLDVFMEKEFHCFSDNELYVELFKRVSENELKEEVDKYYYKETYGTPVK